MIFARLWNTLLSVFPLGCWLLVPLSLWLSHAENNPQTMQSSFLAQSQIVWFMCFKMFDQTFPLICCSECLPIITASFQVGCLLHAFVWQLQWQISSLPQFEDLGLPTDVWLTESLDPIVLFNANMCFWTTHPRNMSMHHTESYMPFELFANENHKLRNELN